MNAQIQKRFRSVTELCTPALAPADENFYEDEAQLAAELAIPLPECLVQTAQPEVAADEFEKVYEWFLS